MVKYNVQGWDPIHHPAFVYIALYDTHPVYYVYHKLLLSENESYLVLLAEQIL